MVVCPTVASGMMPLPGNMSTQPMTVNSDRHSKNKDSAPFYEALAKALKKRKVKIDSICPPSDPVARRILEEYGAIFVAGKKVTLPPVCIFTTEEQVTKFQDDAGFEAELMGYDEVELQPEALKKLNKAREEARKEGLDITPRDGAEAARRNYEDSVRLWNSRFQPALGLLVVAGSSDCGRGGTFEKLAAFTTGSRSPGTRKDRYLLQQRPLKVDSLLDCSAGHFATHRDAGIRCQRV